VQEAQVNTDDLKATAPQAEYRGAAKICASAIRAELKKVQKNIKAGLCVPREQVELLNTIAQRFEREALGLLVAAEPEEAPPPKRGPRRLVS
jgi:hypothetical protein